MPMLGTFLKSVVGVAVGVVVNWAIAKANLGAVTLGTVSISYSQLITVVVLAVAGFAVRNKYDGLGQMLTVGSASQLVLMVLKIVGVVI